MNKVHLIPFEHLENLIKIVLKLAKSGAYNDNLIMTNCNEEITEYIASIFTNKE